MKKLNIKELFNSMQEQMLATLNTQKLITHFYDQKTKNVITKKKFLPSKWIGEIFLKYRENCSQKHSKMFYFKMRKFNNIDFSKTLNFQKTFYLKCYEKQFFHNEK